jgi:hypothetical protein
MRSGVEGATRRFIMMQWFSHGGYPMWLTLVFGLLSIGSAARYALRPERRFVPLVVTLASTTILSGSLGFVTGVIKSLGSLDMVPADRRWIWMLGFGESLVNVAFALALVAVATLATVIGAWKISRQSAPA